MLVSDSFDQELLNTNSLHYGRAAFEGIRSYKNSETGRANPFKLEEHIERLAKSCSMGGIQLPETKERILSTVSSFIKNHDNYELYVRPIIYEADGLGDLGTEYPTKFGLLAWEWSPSHTESGEKLLVSDIRRPPTNAGPVYSKISGNYLQLKIAASAARKAGYDDALLLTSEGSISEASARNIFFRIKNELLTPPPTSCLEGITRQWVISTAADLGVEVKESPISIDMISKAEEVFLTSTASEIRPVQSIKASETNFSYTSNLLSKTLNETYAKEVRFV